MSETIDYKAECLKLNSGVKLFRFGLNRWKFFDDDGKSVSYACDSEAEAWERHYKTLYIGSELRDKAAQVADQYSSFVDAQEAERKADRKREFTLELVKAIATGMYAHNECKDIDYSQIVYEAKELSDECEKKGLLV